MELEQQIWIPAQQIWIPTQPEEKVGPFTRVWSLMLPGARLLDQSLKDVGGLLLLLIIIGVPIGVAYYLLKKKPSA